ncbi:MAG: polysaccharide biosynthesis protein [Eubacteriales bacterium]|nr:polysaccharide biosynthesis protein [Eubacteriales bacterium]
MNSKKTHNFIIQGSILAIAGIVCRIIGMLYRIPLIDIIGTKGNGYYTSAYSIYNILLIISSYSLPTAISKVISVRLAKGRYADARRVLRVAFIYATFAGGIMCGVMYFGAAAIAEMMGKPFVVYVLKTLAPTIWIMAYLGVLRGYFQGSGNMMPTAISQILEQIINAVISVVMAYFLFAYGVKANAIYNETEFSFAYGAAGGTIGTGAGALIALLFFILIFVLYGNNVPNENIGTDNVTSSAAARVKIKTAKTESYGHIAKVLLLTLLPILVSSSVYNISTVLDDFIFSNAMQTLGLGSSIVLLWGVFGEYRILFNIPVAISNSLSSSVIPSLSNAVAEKNKRLVVNKIRLSIRFTMLISIPACIGLMVLAEPICNLLFHSEDNELLIKVVTIGAVAVVFFSLSTITNGILQGLGYLRAPLKNATIALILHVGVLYLLLYVFKLGIYAVIIANIVFAAIVCFLNALSIKKHIRYRQNSKKTYVIPFLASAIMGAVAALLYKIFSLVLPESFVQGRLGLTIILCICIAIAMAVYLIALLLMRAFNKEELLEMPMGLRVYKLARRAGLMR